MTERQHITIDVVSDAVCPWCYIGQKRLDRATDTLSGIDVGIRWRPFQLDPTIPPEGRDRHAYLLAKFGDEKRIEDMHENIARAGAEEGIAFDFGAIKVSPNTLDAHRVIRWAASSGADVQNRVARRLFQLYFEEGADIGDRQVLADAAAECGMDRAVAETLLAGNADTEEVREEIETAARMGVTGVPCFLIEGRYAVMGAQPADVLANAIRQVAEAKARGELENAG
ncbi:MAG TPA: DsbA family oxidoreductase [Rhizobiaceae bacterium]|nr:DsbA family oxidoreductase [Rhizobiaceae bacterium]